MSKMRFDALTKRNYPSELFGYPMAWWDRMTWRQKQRDKEFKAETTPVVLTPEQRQELTALAKKLPHEFSMPKVSPTKDQARNFYPRHRPHDEYLRQWELEGPR